MIDFLSIPLFAFFNRVRGGGFGADKLPGHPRYYVTALLGIWTYFFLSWPAAVIMTCTYFLWSLLPWGRWFDLERMPDDYVTREPMWLEKIIMKVAKNDYWAFTLRNLITTLPLLVLHPAFILFGPIQTGLYEIGWQLNTQRSIEIAEILTGILWAIVFLVTKYFGFL